MTTHEVEARLRLAVTVNPSDDGLRRLDERVARITARPAARSRVNISRWRLLRPVALAAALLLLAGAVGAAMGLLDRTVDQSAIPGWRMAWDRAEVLGLRQTDAGVTVTLERAYADLNQFVAGFTVEGIGEPPSDGAPGSIDWIADLRDPAGRTVEQWATAMQAKGGDETGLSAVVLTWQGAPVAVAGRWELTITSVGYADGGGFRPGACTEGATEPECASPPADRMVDGTWRFTFDLPKPAGAAVSSVVSVTRGQATVTLSDLRISPTMIVGRIALRVDGSTVDHWTTIDAVFRRGAASYAATNAIHVTRGPGDQGPTGDENDVATVAGTGEPAGPWEIVIPALSYAPDDREPESAIRLEGPWTLEVTVP